MTNGWSPPSGPAVPNDGLLQTFIRNHNGHTSFRFRNLTAAQVSFIILVNAPQHPLGTNHRSLRRCQSSFPEMACSSLYEHCTKRHALKQQKILPTLLTRTGMEPSMPVTHLSVPTMKASLPADLIIAYMNRGAQNCIQVS